MPRLLQRLSSSSLPFDAGGGGVAATARPCTACGGGARERIQSGAAPESSSPAAAMCALGNELPKMSVAAASASAAAACAACGCGWWLWFGEVKPSPHGRLELI